jgi:hypothetical protein
MKSTYTEEKNDLLTHWGTRNLGYSILIQKPWFQTLYSEGAALKNRHLAG